MTNQAFLRSNKKTAWLLFLVTVYFPSISYSEFQKDTLRRKKYIVSFKHNTHFLHYNDFYRSNPIPKVFRDRYYSDFSNAHVGDQSFSVQFFNRKNFTSHEIDLRTFHFNLYTSEVYTRRSNQEIGITYQFNYFFVKKERARFLPYAGLSAFVWFNKFTTEFHYNRGRSKTRVVDLVHQVNFVPGVKSYLSKRVYLDLSIPVNLLRLTRYSHLYRNNSQANKHNMIFYVDGLSGIIRSLYQMRLGIGVDLVSSKAKKQSEKTIKYVKMNLGMDFQINDYFKYSDLHKKLPSFTFQNINNPSLIHELELPYININRSRYNEYFLKKLDGSLYYQLSYLFFQKQDLIVKPMISLGAKVAYSRYKRVSEEYDEELYVWNQYESYQFISTGFQICSGKKMYAEISLPLTVFNFGVQHTKTHNKIYGNVYNAVVTRRGYSDFGYIPSDNELNVKVSIGMRL